ncbi:MAG: hypothetical protein Q9177_004810, partial [Variospora cf. flavescens]
MPDQPEMSPATKELLKKVRMMVPPMLEKFHKGTSAGPRKRLIANTIDVQVCSVESPSLEGVRSKFILTPT